MIGERVFSKLPQELRCWHKFGNIKQMEYDSCFDYETWQDINSVRLVLADEKDGYRIALRLKNVSGRVEFVIGSRIAGLDIKDMRRDGYEKSVGFHVYDFEEDGLSIYCEDIEVELLEEEKV